jgi:hypothetical protein
MDCRQFVSDTLSMLRAENLDDFISPPFIISEARSIIADFIKKSNDATKRISKLSEGWSVLPCVKMVEVPIAECVDVDVRLCAKLMRSEKQLPSTYTFTNGDIIKGVSSINLNCFYDLVTPRQWNAIQKREYQDKNKFYYFFRNGYLYIPIPKTQIFGPEEVTVEAYFKDKYQVHLFNTYESPCVECPQPEPIDCLKPLDFQLVMPFYMENDVKKELISRLAKIYKGIQPDEYPNLNSSDKNNQRDLQDDKNGLLS